MEIQVQSATMTLIIYHYRYIALHITKELITNYAFDRLLQTKYFKKAILKLVLREHDVLIVYNGAYLFGEHIHFLSVKNMCVRAFIVHVPLSLSISIYKCLLG